MNSACSSARLELALAGNLAREEESSLHRHLEECEACCAAMEQMAGGETGREEAAALLATDELDQALPLRDECSAIDFVVEHLEPADDPGLLGRLGGYDVLEFIGHGGMGVVFKGFDRELQRCVAIKALAPHLAHSSLARQRFAREAREAAAVVHPHVLAIHHVQPSGRLPFFVMPLVAGESLAQRLARQGMLELREVLRIGTQAAAGLAAAHEQGLIHRDVKPANILLETGIDRAVLTDFGLARAADDAALTRWGIIAGTPQYMSPEQARGEPLSSRSDLFSLGCVLYEMATGVSPFRADSTMATLRRLVDDTPQAMASLNPELPAWFIAVVDRLLEKDPARRFGSAHEVSELLAGCLAHVQQPASVPLPAALPKPIHQSNSKRPFLIRGVIAMFVIVGSSLLAWALFTEADPPAPTAQEAKRTEAQQQPQASADFADIPMARVVQRFNEANAKPGGSYPLITGLAISPNGRWLPLQTWKTEGPNTIRLWDLQTGKPTVTFDLPPGARFSHETFTPDSAYMAARAGDGAIWLWDTTTGKLKWASKEPLARAVPMAFSADGKILFGSGMDKKNIKRWWTENGKLVPGSFADDLQVYGVAANADGTLIVTTCYDNVIRVLDANTGAVANSINGAPAGWGDTRFSGDGKTFAWVSHSRGTKHRLWDVATWKELPAPPRGGEKTFGTPNGFALHPTRRLVAITTSDGLLRLWEIVDGKERLQAFRTATEDDPGKVASRPLAFTPDGQFLAVSHYSGAVSLLRVSDVAP